MEFVIQRMATKETKQLYRLGEVSLALRLTGCDKIPLRLQYNNAFGDPG
jgi:hypothetical protein